ncbi:MAG: YraN family protein [Acidimicrobiia bacterium]
MTTSRRALGIDGERRAEAWYVKHGYVVLARNWRVREGEIDLIVRNATTIVFCEVKTRATAAFGMPAEAVTPAKQARLRRLAGRYLAESSERAGDLRFDVAAVMGGKVEIIEGAF